MRFVGVVVGTLVTKHLLTARKLSIINHDISWQFMGLPYFVALFAKTASQPMVCSDPKEGYT